MCGIAGIITHEGKPAERSRLVEMSGKIAHRGPDGDGIWVQDSVGFVHRRLAIVDLSESGAQPMASPDGRYHIVFNGEIYNYQELRHSLESRGERFVSTSDTEVLLRLFMREGEGVLKRIRGMFAFAIWDRDTEKLFFARDHIGKKPFYYRLDQKEFSFASEISALLRNGDVPDWQAIRSFFGLQYIPSPQTGFAEIKSLPPSSFGYLKRGELEIHLYTPVDRTPKLTLPFNEAAQQLRALLKESVELRLIADVPVGVFLSGGVDSSGIASIAAQASRGKIKTFTMGFPSLGFDERLQAKALAEKLGTEHHEFIAEPRQALEIIDALIPAYGGPYADSSAIPMWLLARETRHEVKAVLSGDGGDELFSGYRRYRYFRLADQLAHFHLSWLGIQASYGMYALKKDPRMKRFAATLAGLQHSPGNGYANLFTGSYFNQEDTRLLLRPEFLAETQAADATQFIANFFQQKLGLEGALDFDLRSYLPDDLNVKLDRATMAHAVEARCPILDERVVQFATHMPAKYTILHKEPKALLKSALYGIVPEEVFSRPKRGFQVPLSEWFRGSLRSAFVERCLSSDMKLLTICNEPFIRRLLKENDRGIDHGNRLWMLFSLSTWLELYD